MTNVKKFFGTDGIRGPVNQGKLSPSSLLKLGEAIGRYLHADVSPNPKVLIGRDTRKSGDMVQSALVAGLVSQGVSVEIAGVMPTPAVATLTSLGDSDLGIMITASHNPYKDNGVKLFNGRGLKLGDTAQLAIEKLMSEEGAHPAVSVADMGSVKPWTGDVQDYDRSLTQSLPDDFSLADIKIVFDGANGAGFEIGPRILETLGAKDIHMIGVDPDGQNINHECGSTRPAAMCEAVVKKGADIGIALDGDADRLIMCDETGRVIDGDQILACVARGWHAQGRLSKPGMVVTVMSNLGLERFFKDQNLTLERTSVGDRHVAARMRDEGYNLGGEQSGHLLMTDFGPTGDGIMAALHVLAEIKRLDRRASEVLSVFDPVPQLLTNVRYDGASPLTRPEVQSVIAKREAEIGEKGRLLIRASGTEPVIRIMVEGDDPDWVKTLSEDLAANIAGHST